MAARSTTLEKGAGAGSIKWVGVTVGVAIIALLASPAGPLGVFWRVSPDWGQPTSGQLPFFILLNIAEVVTFGLGVSFLIFGYPALRSAASGLAISKRLTTAAYFSIVWLLASWWPHDSLHGLNGVHLGGLLGIEYGFHVTLMVAGAILAVFFLQLLRHGAAAR